MRFVEYSIVAVLGIVAATQAYSVTTSPNCTAVQSRPMSLSKVVKNSPYYLLQTSSSTTLGVNVSSIDSVCYTLYSTCNSYTVNVLAIITLSNGSSQIINATLNENSPRNIYFNSSQGTFQYIVLGELCHNTYVIYLCDISQCGSSSDTVVILSTETSVDANCLQQAQCLAANSFPGITFTKLPNTAPYPCVGCSSGNCNCTSCC